MRRCIGAVPSTEEESLKNCRSLRTRLPGLPDSLSLAPSVMRPLSGAAEAPRSETSYFVLHEVLNETFLKLESW